MSMDSILSRFSNFNTEMGKRHSLNNNDDDEDEEDEEDEDSKQQRFEEQRNHVIDSFECEVEQDECFRQDEPLSDLLDQFEGYGNEI